jgi:hypothetical protein
MAAVLLTKRNTEWLPKIVKEKEKPYVYSCWHCPPWRKRWPYNSGATKGLIVEAVK